MKRGRVPLKKDSVPRVAPGKSTIVLVDKDIGELVAEAEERVRRFLDNYNMAGRITNRPLFHAAKGSPEKQCH